MPRVRKPREGSLQFWPRKRTRRIYPRISHWPKEKTSTVKPLGFAGWKAGMTHIIYINNSPGCPTHNKPVSSAVTVLDSPPLFVCGYRFYTKTQYGWRTVGEKWIKEIPKNVQRRVGTKKSSSKVDNVDDIRLLVATQPEKSGMKHKKSEVFELGLSGTDVKKKIEYAESVLGKEIKCSDVFKEGEHVDVVSVTKGHGFTGPVKRFGIKIQTRKNEQHHRHVGSHGPERPGRLDWRVPAAGQYGFFRRTEYNKRIVLIGDDPTKINPKGGFVNYGIVKQSFVVVEGSVPGHKKRLMIFKKSSRAKQPKPITINYISTKSQQGN